MKSTPRIVRLRMTPELSVRSGSCMAPVRIASTGSGRERLGGEHGGDAEGEEAGREGSHAEW